MDSTDHRVILVLGEDEVAVQAGKDYYEKEYHKTGTKKTLLQWRDNAIHLVKSTRQNHLDVSKDSKLVIIGHGSVADEIRINGLNADELSKVILSLKNQNSPLHFRSKSIKMITLLSCGTGAGNEGWKFAEDFLIHLRENYLEVGRISAFKVGIAVLPTGEKVTRGEDNWLRHKSDHKLMAKLGEDNRLKEVQTSVGQDEGWIWMGETSSEPEGLVNYQFKMFDRSKKSYCNLNPEQTDDILAIKTRQIFENAKKHPTSPEISERDVITLTDDGVRVTEKVRVRTINSINDLLNQIQDLTEESLTERQNMIMVEKNKDLLSRKGIAINDDVNENWKNIKNVIESDVDIRHMYYGITNSLKNRNVYFQFGNYVLKMNLENFYIESYGVLDNNIALPDKHSVDYPSFDTQMGHPDEFVNMAKMWVQGQNTELASQFSNLNVYDAMAVIATHVSEVIRNPQTHLMNRMLWDFSPNWKQFRSLNPMTRGGSWSTIHTEIGNNYEPKEKITTLSRSVLYNWLKSIKIRNTLEFIFRQYDEIGLRPMTNNEMQTIIDNDIIPTLPSELADSPNIKWKPSTQLRSLGEIFTMKDMILEKAFQPRLAIKNSEVKFRFIKEMQQVIDKHSKKDNVLYEPVADSIEVEGNVLKMRLKRSGDVRVTKQVTEEISDITLSSKDTLEAQLHNLEGGFTEKPGAVSRVGNVLGIYGTLMGFKAAKDFFHQGRNVEGGISLAQGIHGVGELTQVNKAVFKMLQKSTDQALTRIAQNLENEAAEKLLSGVSKVGVLAESVPLISIMFTGFNIYEDLKQASPIGYADAALDTTILLTSLAGPELEPVVLGLIIIRLGIDSFYHEIKYEIDSLPPDATGEERFCAVMKGIGLGTIDVLVTVYDVWSQFAAISLAWRIPKLREQHIKDKALLEELKHSENYYKIIEERKEGGCYKTIDFTAGKYSSLGGAFEVQLDDKNCVTIAMHDPVSQARIEETQCLSLDCEVNDIVLGVGESSHFQLTKKTETMLFFIPVYSADIISGYKDDETTLFGTYRGNSKANHFYTVQKLPEGFKYTLSNYQYNIYGQNGNDVFYVGPQRTFTQGGNGQDVYYIPETGGNIVIDNLAEDGFTDLMIFNVPFEEISAKKLRNDLMIFYTNSHYVIIKNWFLGEQYKHMKFESSESYTFQIGETRPDNYIHIKIISLDFSSWPKAKIVKLRNKPFENVIGCTGSKFDDTIIGNDLPNVISGGLGADYLEGGQGKDIYFIAADDSCNVLNNFASDAETDVVKIDSDFHNLRLKSGEGLDVMLLDEFSRNTSCIILKNWRRDWRWQHAVFMTRDYYTFQISNKTDPGSIEGLLIDYTDSPKGVIVDLESLDGSDNIVAIIGSPYEDKIYGNSKANFLTGGSGDYLEGRGQSDTYVVQCQENGKTIKLNNFDSSREQDVLLLSSDFNDLQFLKSGKDIVIQHHRQNGCDILLVNWLQSEDYRHLLIKTKDGIMFILEINNSKILPRVQIIDKSNSREKVNLINATPVDLSDTRTIIGSPADDQIFGNDQSNYIDPRKGNAFMQGVNGRDTYVLNGVKGDQYLINNYAEDLKIDILKFGAKFSEISITLKGEDVLLSSRNLTCLLASYASGQAEYQHLAIVSNDGVTFTLSDSKSYNAVPLNIDMEMFQDQHLNLTTGPFSSVTSVHGNKYHPNVIFGNQLSNSLLGGDKSDYIHGNEGDDTIHGKDGTDYLSGGPGDDEIHGGDGDDWILGGSGNDVIFPGQGKDRIHGGLGIDTLLFSGNHEKQTGVMVNLDTGYGMGADGDGDLYFDIENAFGTSYNDILIGNNNNNLLSGDHGNDIIVPLDGDDFLSGGNGHDIYYLAGASGLKIIDNFSTDQNIDLIIVDSFTMQDFEVEKNGLDLVLHVKAKGKINLFGPLLMKNWFKSCAYRNILIKLDNTYNMNSFYRNSC
ncbi:uncharacterized protein LOC114664859 isoform X2 [Erpetoichthys calabaricus]|nr:uncharacterized protein LOC114664859 isoform X2 [Erpetoichthys calabaricus]